MSKRLSNLVFVSGPQGAGKSTLIQHLVKKIPHAISPVLATKTTHFYWGGDEEVLPVNTFHRQALKYAQRAMENYEYLVAALKHPDKLVIGDRSVHDSRTYRKACVKLGWLTEEQSQEMEKKLPILNLEELLDPYAIVLNSGIDVCRNHLKKRQEETNWVKFKEQDTDYLTAVCESFETFKGLENIFYIDRKIDYKDQDSLNSLRCWVDSLTQK